MGESGTGKTCCVRTFAALTGHNLRIMSNNSAMDTTEILGGFEQVRFFFAFYFLSMADPQQRCHDGYTTEW